MLLTPRREAGRADPSARHVEQEFRPRELLCELGADHLRAAAAFRHVRQRREAFEDLALGAEPVEAAPRRAPEDGLAAAAVLDVDRSERADSTRRSAKPDQLLVDLLDQVVVAHAAEDRPSVRQPKARSVWRSPHALAGLMTSGGSA
jgi:hypothetical protein